MQVLPAKATVIIMRQQTFFEPDPQTIPLAARLRPRSLEEFVGQEHLLGEGKVLRGLIDRDQVSSMIFWGPPGAIPAPPFVIFKWLCSMESVPEKRSLSLRKF